MLQEQPASDYGELTEMITAPPAPARVCTHTPPCPSAAQLDRDAAHVLVAHPEQGWSLLCNGVVLFEDTGELLTPDAKSVIGQGLSRFLNVVDGLIGQGLRVLVLVTTNEEIKTLHPAVARPGRAAANVDFLPLSSAEASAWLRERGIDEGADSRTIASLYARLDGRDPGESAPSSLVACLGCSCPSRTSTPR